MSAIAEEVASQPACWREAVHLAPALAGDLPQAGERVAVVGCGTSLHVARAYASLREGGGQGVTDAVAASEWTGTRAYDRVLAISRSGTTTEVVRLLEALGDTPTVVLTAVAGAPVADAGGRAVVLDFVDERSVVQTRFATSVLALLRTHLGEDLAAAIRDGEAALEAPLPAPPAGVSHVAFLGHGWTVGIAEECALKLREASRTYTEAYPAMEYRHGPISLAAEGSVVWILGTPDESIAADARATGALVRRATFDPLAELVLVHRLAMAIAEAKGIDPDHPRHLTRSVVLS